ncbi:MAG TPA: glycoside hydrolase family 9 protein, partial [Puia sp.]|nr:glycoside hydrolase family 9 protein [Puia sp.]
QPGKGIIYQEVWDGYDYFGTPEKETDNIPGTGDDRPFRGEGPSAMTAAALAAAARATGRPDFKKAAEDLWLGAVKSASDYPEDIWGKTSGAFPDLGDDHAGRLVRRTADLLLADIELGALTGEQRFDDNAQSCIKSLAHKQKSDGLWPTDVYSRTALQGVAPASLALYVRAHPGTLASGTAKNALRLWMNGLIRMTNNPFGLIPWDKTVFFNPHIGNSNTGRYYYVGQNSQYLSNAWALYLTSTILKEPGMANLADRQLDWILGLNPYNLCMMEGRGSFNSPCYLHWAPDNDRGAVPGAIPNGFCRVIADQDRPWFDLYDTHGDYNTLEPWEPHNAFFILAVSARAGLVGNR